jgi:hypothetical protein
MLLIMPPTAMVLPVLIYTRAHGHTRTQKDQQACVWCYISCCVWCYVCVGLTQLSCMRWPNTDVMYVLA